MLTLGVDLAGSEKRPTGLCLLSQDMECRVWVVYGDEEIIKAAEESRPDVIAIDAPMYLPRGRRSLHERGGPHFRECDLELRRMGIRFFPITLGPMRMLTERGMRLRKTLEGRGFRVIEVFPGATQDILGLPRKQHSLAGLVRGLRRLGLRCVNSSTTGDEADAVTCALTGLLYLSGDAVELGDPGEGVIVVPRPRDTSQPRRSLQQGRRR